MWKNFKKRVARWLPEHIPNKLIVVVYVVLDALSIVGKKRIKDNFKHNQERFELENTPLNEGFIINQSEWGNIHFGKTTMAFAGCEIMAVYNALLAMGLEAGPMKMGQLISDFERHGAALQGWIGTSPLAIRRYLTRLGINTRLVWKMGELSGAGVTIATIYNDRYDLYSQIHTVALIKEENGYNAYNSAYPVKGCETVQNAIQALSVAPKLICAIEIIE